MEATKKLQLTQTDCDVDIIAQNSEGKTVLLVQVKGTELKGREAKQRAISPVKSYLQSAKTDIPFIMLVDLRDTEVFQWDNANLWEPVSSLNTAAVLNHYDPEFSSKRIFGYYLETLVEAWLRDLAYHWKSEKPPASEELASIGLLQQLEGGATQSEVDAWR